MTNRSQLRERYLRDPLAVQLGGLAANLARVRSFSDNPAHREVVAHLLEESVWFIEWAAPDAPADMQMALVDCQRALSRWRLSWAEIWADPKRRGEVAERAGAWSQQLLSLSGLVQAAALGSGGHRA
jgi:hypothetical protein